MASREPHGTPALPPGACAAPRTPQHRPRPSRAQWGTEARAAASANLAHPAPSQHQALLRRAAVYMEIENWKAAIGAYEAAQEAEPEDRSIAQGLRQAKLELKKSLRKDLYKVLGIDKKASEPEIKKGYKMSALRCHPDRHASGSDEAKAKAEVMFKEVGEAFEILSDPEKKQRYDQGEDVEEINGNSHGHSHGGGGPGGMSQADIFNMFNSQMGGGGGRGSRGGGGFPGGFPGGGF